MPLYLFVCENCKKKVYLNMEDYKKFIDTGRQRLCPECKRIKAAAAGQQTITHGVS
ncbi:hypothetical protein [Pseudobutyrivibrio sp.]|uniref:hypothetical protein n=1 Tax=Pseudobutyrivibrio sp. TaxID=2014367 RepID=UPI0038679F7E